MVILNTILKVSDNSVAKYARCIKVLGGFKRSHANIGNVIVVSVTKLRNKSKITSKVKKGEVYKALIIRTKKRIFNKGFIIYFNFNDVCLLNKQGKPIATRIFGPLPKELKKKKWTKITSLSSGFI